MKPVQTFIVSANLPKKLSKLKELAFNYWWCWNSDAKELFLRINRNLWEEVNHNPVKLINKLTNEQLLELENQTEFTSFLDYIHKKFLKYMESQSWYENYPEKENGTVAYFSTEYGINESFPNYSGGLGVLSGDHLKSASDLGIPLIGVGLLYQQGYFRQHLTQHGWQTELYNYNDFYSMPLIQVRNQSGEPLEVTVDMPAGKVFIQIWKLQIGRVNLFLLDTNYDKNTNEEYRDITDQLYGGTRETRIQQEIVLGIGGIRALMAMGLMPDAMHINEGHAAFALLERTKYYMEKYNLDFRSAKQITRSSSIFTTHTPVPAGNETFKLDLMDKYFNNYIGSLGLSKEEFYALGQQGQAFSADEDYSMTVVGLRLTSYHNGVSKLHGEVAREMWHQIWRCFPINEVPIRSITNGIHTMTWIAREFAELFDRYLTPRWKTDTDQPEVWEGVDIIPQEELWREKQRRRVRLVLFARQYLLKCQKGFLAPEQVSRINSYLDPDALTIGFARRFATYKRATLLFRDMDRLAKILTNTEKPVQIIIAGKAHPHDTQGKEVIQSIIQKVRAYGLDRHVVFLEDYDMVIARFMVKGCDVWLNTPIRPMEASGTSGMKAAINGTLNLSILDGWWDEAFDGTNGFSIGHGEVYMNTEEQAIIESGALYDLLEQEIVPMFYDRKISRIPDKWITYMKNSIKTNACKFSTMRMLKDYCLDYYLPAIKNFKTLTSNNAQKAVKYKEWKDMVRNEWKYVEIIDFSMKEESEFFVGKPINVRAIVSLGGLTPKDVVVQVYYGSLDPHDELDNTGFETLNLVKSQGNIHHYEGSYICPDTGQQGFTLRVLPTHPYLADHAELYLCAWAK